MEMKGAKILIINSESVTNSNATGITLKNIFSNIPIENIFEITCSPSAKESIYRGKTMKILPYKYYIPNYILNFSLSKRLNSTSKKVHNRQNIQKGRNNISTRLREFLIALADSMPIISPKPLLLEVSLFSPDIIYTMGASNLVLKLCNYFSKKTGKKIIIHHMDNWVETMYSSRIFMLPFRMQLLKLISKTYMNVNVGLTISHKMAEDFSLKWNTIHLPLLNFTDSIVNQPNVNFKNNHITLVYTGGLHLNRWKSLLEVSDIVENINSNSDFELHLYIYTSDAGKKMYRDLFRMYSKTIFKEYVEHSEINNLLQMSDILLHIESFEEINIKFIKYSISTKISEYLACGKPIIIYAPEKITLTEYLSENKAALTTCKKEELEYAIRLFCDSTIERYNYANNAINCALKYHTRESAIETFIKAIDITLVKEIYHGGEI